MRKRKEKQFIQRTKNFRKQKEQNVRRKIKRKELFKSLSFIDALNIYQHTDSLFCPWIPQLWIQLGKDSTHFISF